MDSHNLIGESDLLKYALFDVCKECQALFGKNKGIVK